MIPIDCRRVVPALVLFLLQATTARADILQEMEDQVRRLVERASPAVYLVEAEPDPAKFKINMPANPAYRYVRRGSAFAWSTDGFLITSNSVVADSARIHLVKPDRTRVEAELVASDPETDVALLKVSIGRLPRVLSLREDPPAKPGSFALVIGPEAVPLRVGPSWVSHTDYRLPGYRDPLIVINAPVDAGAAGTPVLGSDGRVAGMVYAGGFGRSAVNWTLVHKSRPLGVLGVVAQPESRNGQVRWVHRLSSDEKTGLRIQVDGRSRPEIVRVLADGTEQIVERLEAVDPAIAPNRDDQKGSAKNSDKNTDRDDATGASEWTDLGFGNTHAAAMAAAIGPPTYVIPADVINGVIHDLKAKGRVPRGQLGVAVVDDAAGARIHWIVKGGPAETAGFATGDVIVSLAGRSVAGADDFIRILRSRRLGESVVVVANPGGKAGAELKMRTIKLGPLSVRSVPAQQQMAPPKVEPKSSSK